jgi:DNA (cytosine-5)-methyltransferase 1
MDVSAQLTAGGGKPGEGYPAALDNHRPRRLTPRECERLQSFPDDWTLVDGMADGPRYRMMGNAVTVNVAEWIGKRIIEHG